MNIEEFPVLKYTTQLYYCPIKRNLDIDNTPPIQIASGILVKNGSKYFLLTCKHVFDNIKSEDVIILTRSGFSVRLPNEVAFINNDNDSIDLALVQLKAERVKELKNCYSFLPDNNLGFQPYF